MSDHGFTTDRFNWLKQVLADHTLPPNAFRLAFAICTYVNRYTRFAFPEIETLAEKIGLSVRKTRALRARLIKSGHVTIKAGTGIGRGNVSHYSMALREKEDPSVPLSDEKEDPSVRKRGPQGATNSWTNSKREGGASNAAPSPTPAPDGAGGISAGVVTSLEWHVFDSLWRDWSTGRRKADSQSAAWTAWQAARQHGEVSAILAGARAWMAAQQPRYRQALDQWLNNGGWMLPAPSKGKEGGRRDKRTHTEKTAERMGAAISVTPADAGIEELTKQFHGRAR
jgi:hypothetical protein